MLHVLQTWIVLDIPNRPAVNPSLAMMKRNNLFFQGPFSSQLHLFYGATDVSQEVQRPCFARTSFMLIVHKTIRCLVDYPGLILLMAEILHHLGCIFNPINNGIKYLSTG